ncbi:MAG: PD40 domain-containing protein [Bacteroidales bacterium]|nr:PD40 domain-containing protein [Bacteroidales bacterium]
MKKSIVLLTWMCFVGLRLPAQEEARLLRFPAIHGDQVVFTYAGDLYTVDREGGTARKLTDHEGYEMFARFSPDGSHIAFTGQYDGNTEVFLIPSGGGVPERLTYTATLGRDDISDRMGPNNIVMTWRDNQSIVFRSRMKSFNSFKGQLFIADVKGGLPVGLPLPSGGFCSYSPDGKKLAFNRVFREFRTWKYYKGGMADDVWIYDFETRQTTNVTNNNAQDIIPMWYGDEIFFLSDRDRVMNLFVFNTLTGETGKLTNYTEFDIKFPSLGNNAIIYENGGFIYIFDLQKRKAEKMEIVIANDFNEGRDVLKDASKSINSWAVSPDGKRLVFGARGDVFTVPASSGITRNLTKSAGVHDRNVEWSPDGKYISFISDRTGEDEIYIQAQDGSGEDIQLTFNSDTYKYNPVWSPDSKKLLWSDRLQRLQYLNTDSKAVVVVDQTPDGEFFEFSWSGDSRWIAYAKPARDEMSSIYIYNLETAEKHPVTDGWYAAGDPVFSDDGKYLFFTSSRDFNPVYSWTEWNHAYRDMLKIYFLTLRKDIDNPLKPENDEVSQKAGEITEEAKDKEEDDAREKVEIDFDGIIGRIVGLPVKAGSYWNLALAGGNVYYAYNSASDEKASLKYFDFKSKEEKELGEYGNFIISSDKKKMALNVNGKYTVIDLPKSKISAEKFADLGNMKVWVNLKEEWAQIYHESWRQMRDFFYDPNMHGVDWNSIRVKYQPLVSYVNNRNDLNYIIGEMIGELNVGHAYVSGGDKPAPERIKTGLPGAEFTRDNSGFYKITKILRGENWTKNTRSPLTEVGVDIHEGDYIIEINGQDVSGVNDIYSLLVAKAGVQVELTVNSLPQKEGSRKEIIVPLDDVNDLYYYNWVQDNLKKVEEKTGGQVGYIHIPDMSAQGLNEFVKYYYPQLKKRALIIDDRGNGGGNVSPMIIERLRRELAMMRISRNGSPRTSPAGMQYGPKVMLIDNYSASDGDLFPYQFRKYGLGKLIGVRTWGGVVGIRGSLPFIDGGNMTRPEFATYDAEGKEFVIEGHGVEPDIWIDNDPAREYAGEDQQLDKAIEVILEELKNWPEGWPEIPPYPDKSR